MSSAGGRAEMRRFGFHGCRPCGKWCKIAAMKVVTWELIEGLGLCVLALGFGCVMLYGVFVAVGQSALLRAAVFAVLALFALYWGTRLTLAELARFRERSGQRS